MCGAESASGARCCQIAPFQAKVTHILYCDSTEAQHCRLGESGNNLGSLRVSATRRDRTNLVDWACAPDRGRTAITWEEDQAAYNVSGSDCDSDSHADTEIRYAGTRDMYAVTVKRSKQYPEVEFHEVLVPARYCPTQVLDHVRY
eukprot:627970-Rhodomonas_salina.2